jgi:hypothetical protein
MRSAFRGGVKSLNNKSKHILPARNKVLSSGSFPKASTPNNAENEENPTCWSHRGARV